MNFRQQVYDQWKDGIDISEYDRNDLMNEKYDATELSDQAGEKIRTFQKDAAKEAGIFHHLIATCISPAALSTDNLAKEYFGDQQYLVVLRCTKKGN